MKKLTLILLSIFLIQVLNAQQGRYQDDIFEEVQVTYDITYGTNIDIFNFDSGQNTGPVPTDLKLDFYEPAGDSTGIERPLVLVFHDGVFLPPLVNGRITGTKSDSSCVEICTRLAKKGYVAASLDYRLGWNPFEVSMQNRAITNVQAMYRAVQDGNTAIRFFRKTHAEDGNPYGVDSSKIVAWGLGSGGVISLNMAALSDVDEFLNDTNPPGKLLYDLDEDGIPDIPMIQEGVNGDIEGKLTTIIEEDILFYSAGDTSSLGNHPDYSSDFNLSVNISGSVIDTSWLSDNTIPTISYHSSLDPYYPYGNGYYFPLYFLTDLTLQVHGAQLNGEYQNTIGNDQQWIDAEDLIHAVSSISTDRAIDNSATLEHPYYQSVFPFISSANSNDYNEGIVIDWWDPSAPSPDGTPWNELMHPSGSTFHEYSLLFNEGMSAEKARANIDSIMEYFIPRACVTLDLDCPFLTLSIDDPAPDLSIITYPNPTNEIIVLDAQQSIINDVLIYDSKGALLKTYPSLNTTRIELRLDDLKKGLYFIRGKVGGKIFIRKIVLE